MQVISHFDHIKAAFLDDCTFIYPTEGVYGIGCNPLSQNAVNKVLNIKKRDAQKGLILIAGRFEQIRPFIDITPKILQKIEGIYPSFTTCIVPKSSNCPKLISGNHSSVAFRLSDHPVVKKLCDAFDSAIVSTSANISSKPPITNQIEAFQTFDSSVDFFIKGELGCKGKPSRIIKIDKHKVVVIRE